MAISLICHLQLYLPFWFIYQYMVHIPWTTHYIMTLLILVYSEVFWDVVDLVMFLGMLFFNIQDLGMSEIGYLKLDAASSSLLSWGRWFGSIGMAIPMFRHILSFSWSRFSGRIVVISLVISMKTNQATSWLDCWIVGSKTSSEKLFRHQNLAQISKWGFGTCLQEGHLLIPTVDDI